MLRIKLTLIGQFFFRGYSGSDEWSVKTRSIIINYTVRVDYVSPANLSKEGSPTMGVIY